MAETVYKMSLAEVLIALGYDSDSVEIRNNQALIIEHLSTDSRALTTNSLFIAYPGHADDGREYLQQAQDAGAKAILYESGDGFKLPDAIRIPCFAVAGLREQLGYLAHRFYAQPSHDLQVFGVTGTNGKTTCAYLLAQALSMLDVKAAFIGTIGVGEVNALTENTHTTPDAIALHQRLAEFRDCGITQVCMEVSSHALDQGRVNGVNFFCTLFTNLSQDHLDYHGDMASYAAAKQRLFTDFDAELTITNHADSFGRSLLDAANAEFIVSYGDGGDVIAAEYRLSTHGMSIDVEANSVDFSLQTPLVGKVNLPNVLMVVTTLLSLSIDVLDIQRIVSQLKPAPGRMEKYSQDGLATVVIDYAHTPDALEKALLSIREHCDGALWCLMGCGGDRDATKRPLMGAAADKAADFIVITNDNPRSEEPAEIAAAIQSGMQSTAKVELDRGVAIVNTVNSAQANDWVLIAGKGHETTQEIAGVKHPFSDREHVLAALGAVA